MQRIVGWFMRRSAWFSALSPKLGECMKTYWRRCCTVLFLAVALIGTLGGARPAGAQTQTAVEFYYAAWDAYFITSFADEQAGLDGGASGGNWHRTGQTFNVWSQPVGGALPACRFFSTIFAPKSSHFYTPSATECATVKSDPSWQYEGIAFYLRPADAAGACASGSTALFRLYNDGMGGAPNHRYTTSSATADLMRAAGWILEGNGPASVFACVPQSSTPEPGWWWNPNESGRWFFVESQNGVAEVGNFLYENDGRASWQIAGGPNADPYSFSGRLSAYRNGQTLFGDYKTPAAPTDAGAVSLTFSDDAHGAMTWPGGTTPLERRRFGSGTASFQPDSGWWWNPDQSGRNFSIEVQGDSLFVIGSMYDDSGNPIWYSSAGKMASPTTYKGSWQQFANGQTLAGAYRSPTGPVTVGQLTVEFTALDEATLTFTDSVTAAAAGFDSKANKIIEFPVKRKHPAKPTYDLPARYDGRFTLKMAYDKTISGISQKFTTVVTGDLTWVQDPGPASHGLRSPASSYVLKVAAGSKPIVLTYDLKQDGAGTRCLGHFMDSFALSDNGSFLDVNSYAQYIGSIDLGILSGGDINVTCTHDDPLDPPDHISIPIMVPVQMSIKGATIVYGITGVMDPRQTAITEQTISGDWSFATVTK